MHVPPAGAARAHGVIVCGPFGREAIRVHRLLRVVADRLARDGIAVLRFDYFGAGESAGMDSDADLDGWSRDVLTADRELRRRTGLQQVIWLGIRLGAAAAAAALAHASPSGTRLVLWDPISNGESYLGALRSRHAQSVDKAFSIRPRSAARSGLLRHDEALGYGLPDLLADQIRRVSIEAIGMRLAGHFARILFDPNTDDGRYISEYTRRAPDRVQPTEIVHGLDWLSSAAPNVTLVPAPAVSGLTSALKDFR